MVDCDAEWTAEETRLKDLLIDEFPGLSRCVNATLARNAEIRESLQKAFVSKNFSLDARWELFKQSKDLLQVHTYTSRAMDILSDCLYDDFYIERRETKDYADIDESLIENYEPESTDEYSIRANARYAKRDEWREAVLSEGYRGFTYDW